MLVRPHLLLQLLFTFAHSFNPLIQACESNLDHSSHFFHFSADYSHCIRHLILWDINHPRAHPSSSSSFYLNIRLSFISSLNNVFLLLHWRCDRRTWPVLELPSDRVDLFIVVLYILFWSSSLSRTLALKQT